MHSRESLARDAAAMGIHAGDLLMVHASVRAVGAVAGGPDQIHLALADAVGATGSLFMYASCPDHYDQVGTGTLPADVEAELRRVAASVRRAHGPFAARQRGARRAVADLAGYGRERPRRPFRLPRAARRRPVRDAAVGLRVRSRVGAGASRLAPWAHPPARQRPRRRHLPPPCRACARRAGQARRALPGAGARGWPPHLAVGGGVRHQRARPSPLAGSLLRAAGRRIPRTDRQLGRPHRRRIRAPARCRRPASISCCR